MANARRNDHDGLFTIEQVAGLTRIPVTTIRKYMARYVDFMHLQRGKDNRILFDQVSMEDLARIRVWIGERKSPGEIKGLLVAGKVVKPKQEISAFDHGFGVVNANQDGQLMGKMAVCLARLDQLTTVVNASAREMEAVGKVNAQLFRENQALKNRVLMLEAHQMELSRALETPLWKKVLGRIWKR